MKGISLKKIFTIILIIFVFSFSIVWLASVSDTHLPITRFTHDCKHNGNITFDIKPAGNNGVPANTEYRQGFCSSNYHVELKESLNNTINNIAVPTMFLSGLLLIPTGSVLIFRLISKKLA